MPKGSHSEKLMFSKSGAYYMRTQMPKIQFFHDNSWSILPHAGPAALSEHTICFQINGSLVFQGSCAGFVCVPSQLHFLKIRLLPQSPISLHFPVIPPHVCLVITGHNFPVIKSNWINTCLCAAQCERALFPPFGSSLLYTQSLYFY